jgi:hypothetical protein
MIPVFIGGSPRSGTTITLELLGKHSEFYASVPDEIKILTQPNGLLDLFDNKKITNEEVKTEHFNFFKNQIEFKQNTKYLGDSTPNNVIHALRINNIFLDAKFINLIRDGRDTAYSLYLHTRAHADGWTIFTRPQTEIELLLWWEKRIIESTHQFKKINKDKCISLRFEDLAINDKQSSFLKILNFLNIKNETECQNFLNNKINIDQMSVGIWKDNIKEWQNFNKKYDEILLNLKKQGIFIEKYY